MFAKLLRYWTKKLGLDEWTIVIKPDPEGEDLKRNELAHCDWIAELRAAVIRIRNPEQIEEANEDPEEVLVHELLHILLQGHLNTFIEHDEEFEKAIDKLAALLVRFSRRGRRKKDAQQR